MRTERTKGVSPITARLVDLAWAIHTGDEAGLRDLRTLVEKQGGIWRETWSEPLAAPDGATLPPRLEAVVIRGPSGVTGGIMPGHMDPVTAYVQLCCLLTGQAWPRVPEAAAGLNVIDRRWAEAVKASRQRERRPEAEA